MIDNIILLITGTLHQRQISELLPKCHPLGGFEQMEAMNIASTPAELYNAVLVDTPLGKHNPLSKHSPLGKHSLLGKHSPLGKQSPLGKHSPLGTHTPLAR